MSEIDLTEAIAAGLRAYGADAYPEGGSVRRGVEAAVRAAAPIIERAALDRVRAGDPWVATIAAGVYEGGTDG